MDMILQGGRLRNWDHSAETVDFLLPGDRKSRATEQRSPAFAGLSLLKGGREPPKGGFAIRSRGFQPPEKKCLNSCPKVQFGFDTSERLCYDCATS